MKKEIPNSVNLARSYASKVRSFAKTQAANMAADDLLLSLDGTRKLTSSDTAQHSSAESPASQITSLNANSPHPVIELLDGLFAYLLLYRDPLWAHSAQKNCQELYQRLCVLSDSYHQSVELIGDSICKVSLINEIRAAVWTAVQDRDHGEFYDLAWTFLMRTSPSDQRACFEILSLADIYPYQDGVGTEHNTPEAFKAGFTKTIAAATKVQAENHWALEMLFIWISNVLAILFNSLQDRQVYEDYPPASVLETTPSPAPAPGLTVKVDGLVVDTALAVSTDKVAPACQVALSTLRRLRQPASPASGSGIFSARGSDAGSVASSDMSSGGGLPGSPRSTRSDGPPAVEEDLAAPPAGAGADNAAGAAIRV